MKRTVKQKARKPKNSPYASTYYDYLEDLREQPQYRMRVKRDREFDGECSCCGGPKPADRHFLCDACYYGVTADMGGDSHWADVKLSEMSLIPGQEGPSGQVIPQNKHKEE